MAKMVIDCADPNDMDAVDRAIEKAIGSCNITYFRQHQAMVGASVSSSERESSRIIADEAGEDPESVRNKIRKGKVEVGIEYPDTPIENESHSAVIRCRAK